MPETTFLLKCQNFSSFSVHKEANKPTILIVYLSPNEWFKITLTEGAANIPIESGIISQIILDFLLSSTQPTVWDAREHAEAFVQFTNDLNIEIEDLSLYLNGLY